MVQLSEISHSDEYQNPTGRPAMQIFINWCFKMRPRMEMSKQH